MPLVIAALTGAVVVVGGERERINDFTGRTSALSNWNAAEAPLLTKQNAAEPELSKSLQARSRHPRFFDPILVFTEQSPSAVKTSLLSDGSGVVVDIDGVMAPSQSIDSLVAKDDRIQGIKRVHADAGTKYIITMKTPLKRIETEFEGRVVMVYPLD